MCAAAGEADSLSHPLIPSLTYIRPVHSSLGQPGSGATNARGHRCFYVRAALSAHRRRLFISMRLLSCVTVAETRTLSGRQLSRNTPIYHFELKTFLLELNFPRVIAPCCTFILLIVWVLNKTDHSAKRGGREQSALLLCAGQGALNARGRSSARIFFSSAIFTEPSRSWPRRAFHSLPLSLSSRERMRGDILCNQMCPPLW